ncbi:MAG: cysteine desulfurase [Ignavibacteria bacterium]|nr:cysteine desulfurase [Ignavibacteria bacterium]
MKFPVYLDNNATTPVDPEVLHAMLPYYKEKFGNASSKSHKFGIEASEAVDFYREQTANLVGANKDEIVFTSGATESVNLALKGASMANSSKGKHIVTSKVEHKAVLDSCRFLEKIGFEITYLDVDEYGLIDIEELKKSLNVDTILVSIITANNEIGTIQPIAEIAEICKKMNILFHTDATQAAGKIPVDVKEMNIDLLSFSAHKMYGPKGVGALYIKRNSEKISLVEQISGGRHEQGLRSGTLNVPGIVGFGKACRLSKDLLYDENQRLTVYRDRMINNILQNVNGAVLNGHPAKRLPNNVNFCFEGLNSNIIISELKELAISAGSACISGNTEPSYVLKAIGRSDELADSSIRISFGRFNTDEEVKYSIKRVVEGINKLRNRIL